ncbi:hypothetical protein [Leptolyngbya sp. FACHB-261]|uniref:hypothetical protein n=1 Tax=Leptolyngbya sp. FACHB-261 TaxID=2692806 RepID=UPI001686FB3E|nr:hypothetical protein [Leptolyngbya sp. FACHB-261]MBD2101059.1 hypothetical protein [Leptolyngbya sp. FACHB-261]
MNTELSQAQNIELSDAELEGVAGGAAAAFADSQAFADGDFLVLTGSDNFSQAIGASAVGVDAGTAASVSTAIGV